MTEEQLQAGKAEIMKIVAGLNGAEKLADLLDKGRKKGNLSSNELMDALEEIDLESDQMDKIYDVLENMGIDTAGEDYLPELSGTTCPPWRRSRRSRGGDRRPQHPGGLLWHR